MSKERRALLTLALASTVAGCSAGHHNNSAASFSISVDDAKLDRAIAGLQPGVGDVFVDVGVTLTNLTETTPLPATFSLYTLTTASLPTHLDYANPMGTLKATAPIATVSPIPCGAPGLRCSDGADCCTGVCEPTSKICSLISGACKQAGAGCNTPLEC